MPEKSTLDWLNLNALAPKAIQGAIDRIRHNTLASSGDAEVPKLCCIRCGVFVAQADPCVLLGVAQVPKEMDGELLTSPRGKGSDQSAGVLAPVGRVRFKQKTKCKWSLVP